MSVKAVTIKARGQKMSTLNRNLELSLQIPVIRMIAKLYLLVREKQLQYPTSAVGREIVRKLPRTRKRKHCARNNGDSRRDKLGRLHNKLDSKDTKRSCKRVNKNMREDFKLLDISEVTGGMEGTNQMLLRPRGAKQRSLDSKKV